MATATEARTISPEEQVANVQACLVRAVRNLRDCWGKTVRDAKAILADRRYQRRTAKGRAFFAKNAALYADSWEAVSCLSQWRELRAAYAAGELRSVTDEVPF